MRRRLFRLTGFRLGILLTLLFCLVKVLVDLRGPGQFMVLQFLDNIENTLLDMKFRARGYPTSPEEVERFRDSAHVVICAVDEKSIRMPDLGMWPWRRAASARLIEQLERCGAEVIGFDVVYSEPDASRVAPVIAQIAERYLQRDEPDPAFAQYLKRTLAAVQGDRQLAAVLEQTDNVVLGYFFFTTEEEIRHLDREEVIDQGMDSIGFGTIGYIKKHPRVDLAEVYPRALGVRANLPLFTDAVEYYGFFNQLADEDRIYRRVPMLFAYRRSAAPGQQRPMADVFPSLSLQVLSLYYGQPVNLYAFTHDGETFLPHYTGLYIGPIGPPTDEHIAIPVESAGRFRLNFYGPKQTFRHVSAGDIIHGEPAACRAVADKVVLVGVTTMGIYDLRPMPYESNYPGVELHATAVENVIRGDFLSRPYAFGWLEAGFMLLIGLGFSWLLNRFRLTTGLIITLLVWAAVMAVDFAILFPAGIWAQTVPLAAQIIVLFLAIAVWRYVTEERQKRETRRAFQFYLSKDVIDAVLKDTTKLGLGGERRELTVLFSDIRGFTTISEGLAPEDLTALLNEYLTPMTDLVFAHRGTLDKYMGDAIMAFYGAPIAFADHPHAACHTALEMMSVLAELRQGWRQRDLPEIDIGIGINTGVMSVGNMGSVNRFDYTVMGDHVNLGSRLEGLNKQYGSHVIVSEFTRAAIGDAFTCRELDSVAVKGKQEPVHIFELLHAGPPTGQDAWIAEFDAALAAYRAQRWFDAIAGFKALAEARGDGPARIFIERCRQMHAAPPGEGWDGVFRMKTK